MYFNVPPPKASDLQILWDWTFYPILWIIKEFFYFFFHHWTFALIVIVFVYIKFFFRRKYSFRSNIFNDWSNDRHITMPNKLQDDKQTLYNLRRLTPNEFENFIADVFKFKGYHTEVIGGAYDGGIDVIAERDGIEDLIQCKKYFSSRQVTVSEVRDFYGAITDRLDGGKGYFITTSRFTPEAERFAEGRPIELIDGYRLLEMI